MCRNQCPDNSEITVRMFSKTVSVCVRNMQPKGVKLPNNFKNKSNKKVLIRMKHKDEMATQRMSLSEHPFGTVKWYNFGHYVLCRGIEKVTAELGLCFLAYNLRRAINMVGVQKLIAAM